MSHPLPRNPSGWFALAFSHELAPGEVKAVSASGRELVLFRTESGAAAVLDAHCAHMGTHLGDGEVDGECLRCPFHRWGWGAGGACADIPYARKIPPGARVRAYPVHERNGVVLAWFHPGDEAPGFDVPRLDQEGWSPSLSVEHTLRVHIQEVAENGVDIAHFPPVHRSGRAALEVRDAKGIPFHHVLQTSYDGDGIGVPGRVVRVTTEWRYYGPGVFLGLSRADDFGTEVRHLFHFTPVPDDHLTFRVQIAVKLATVDPGLVDFVLRKNAEITVRNLDEDAPIWAKKRWLPRAALCEGDGPVALVRRWARPFYGVTAEGAAEPADEAPSPDAYAIAADGVARMKRPLRSVAAGKGAPPVPEAKGPAPESPGSIPTADAVRRVFFDQMPRSFDASAVAAALVVQYEIGGDAGGAYFMEVDAERCLPREGTHAAPTLRVAIDAGDWLLLNAGDLDGAQAFLSGRLRVDGDLEAAMRLGQIFRLPAASAG